MRKVALGSTFYFYFSTRRFSTGASYTLAGTPAIHAYEDNSDTQITSGITISADADSVTGLNRVTVVATAANGYEAGKHYTFTIGAGTVDSVSVVGTVVYECMVETVTEEAQRLYLESVYPNGCTIATTTGNTTGRINLTDVLDAQSVDEDYIGHGAWVWDATNGQTVYVVLQSVQSARLFNVVTFSEGAAMDFTVAASDRVWITGPAPLRATTPGRTLDVSAGGEAGLDWANVGSPTTTVGLSGTTVKTATDVETDTADIQSRLPAALTGAGNIKADALAWNGTATNGDGSSGDKARVGA